MPRISIELELEVSGTVIPGCPATGPSYSSGGEPGEPDNVEDASVDALVFTVRGHEYRYKLLQPNLVLATCLLDLYNDEIAEAIIEDAAE